MPQPPPDSARVNALWRNARSQAPSAECQEQIKCPHQDLFRSAAAARAEVMRLRGAIMALFKDLGAAHLQIGRRYPCQEGLKEAPPRQLLRALKQLLDPEGRINPGALLPLGADS